MFKKKKPEYTETKYSIRRVEFNNIEVRSFSGCEQSGFIVSNGRRKESLGFLFVDLDDLIDCLVEYRRGEKGEQQTTEEG